MSTISQASFTLMRDEILEPQGMLDINVSHRSQVVCNRHVRMKHSNNKPAHINLFANARRKMLALSYERTLNYCLSDKTICMILFSSSTCVCVVCFLGIMLTQQCALINMCVFIFIRSDF